MIVYLRGMDAVSGLLDGPRAREAFLLRAVLDSPWSLRIEDEAPLALLAIGRGDAWVVPDDGTPERLGAGDVVIVRGPGHYTLADHPDTPPQVVVYPGQDCRTRRGESLAEAMRLGVRTWGHNPDGAVVMLVGAYESQGEVGARLLGALPAVLVVRGNQWSSPLLALLADEMVKDEPGQQAVLDRLLDLVVIAVLRVWLARPDAGAPPWYRAHGDPVVGPALRLLHNNPAHPWTVAALAREAGVSRAALARRFTKLVGEPPMSFLTNWRLALAADLLCAPDATVGSVASQVGYSTPYALSAAFKRVRGTSPKAHRLTAMVS